MRVILALALIGLGFAFLFWGPWSPGDPADIEPPRPLLPPTEDDSTPAPASHAGTPV